MKEINFKSIKAQFEYEEYLSFHVELFYKWGHLRITVWNYELRVWWLSE